MKNDNKNLNPIGELKANLNVPKTETRIILNDWQSETKKSKLSPAARSKVVNHNKPYQSQNQEGYGPCKNSLCGCSCYSDVCNCKISDCSILEKRV
jgi:hypothetical protein